MIALRWNIAQSFERWWWHNYLRSKDNHTYLDWKQNYWDSILEQTFVLIGGKSIEFKNNSLRILDAGCGPSGIFLNLRKHEVDALDPLINQYFAEHQLVDKADYPNSTFIKGKLESFTSPPAYDFIFCMNCINHVNDIERCTQNLYSALKQGGFLVMTVDAHNYSLAKTLLSLVPADVLHPYQLSISEYSRLLESKFNVTEVKKRLVKSGVLFDHYLMAVQKI